MSSGPGQTTVIKSTTMTESMKTEEIRSFRSGSFSPLPLGLSPGLIPEPEPEIVLAPSPTHPTAKNQVMQKIKTFEQQVDTETCASPVSGGVRIIPVKVGRQTPTPAPVVHTSPLLPTTAPPLSPAAAPSTSSLFPLLEPSPILSFSDTEQYSMLQTSLSPTPSTKLSPITRPHPEIQKKADAPYIKPSKFVAEKWYNYESDSDKDFGSIEPVWKPVSSPIPPPYQTPTPISTPITSAFVSVPVNTLPTSQKSAPAQFSPVTDVPIKPPVPPKPMPGASKGIGVKGIAKTWPPVSPEIRDETHSTAYTLEESSFSRKETSEWSRTKGQTLSPYPNAHRSRSPTPNKEALEMDKLWGKSLGSSFMGTKAPQSAPPPTFPDNDKCTTAPKQQFQPSVPSAPSPAFKPCPPPKPQQTMATASTTIGGTWRPMGQSIPTAGTVRAPSPYKPAFPCPPLVPPKPSGFSKQFSPKVETTIPIQSPSFTMEQSSTITKQQSSGNEEPARYYEAVVSAPKTTPTSPPMHMVSETVEEERQPSSFKEKKQFFEQSIKEEKSSDSSSFQQKMSESSLTKQTFFREEKYSSSSSTSSKTLTMGDGNFMLAPEEPPQFLFASGPGVVTQESKMSSTSQVSYKYPPATSSKPAS